MNRRAKIQGTGAAALDLVGLYQHANDRLAMAGVSVAQVADEARTVQSRVYAYQAQDGDTLLRVLSIIVAQATLGEALVLQRIAEQAGFLLVPMPSVVGTRDVRNLVAVQHAMRQAIEATEAFANAVADNHVTKAELTKLITEVREAETALEALPAIAAELAGERLQGGPWSEPRPAVSSPEDDIEEARRR